MAFVVVTYANRRTCPYCNHQWDDRANVLGVITCIACLTDFSVASGIDMNGVKFLGSWPVITSVLQKEPDRGLY